MRDFAVQEHKHFQRLCSHCTTAFNQQLIPDRLNMVVYHEPDYARHILEADPMAMMMLSLVDHSLQISRRIRNGFAMAIYKRESLLDYPLVGRRAHNDVVSMDEHVMAVYVAMQRLFHPLYMTYLPVMEWTIPAVGVPCIPAEAVSHIVSKARDRGPLTRHEQDPVHPLTTIVDYTSHMSHPGLHLQAFKGGRLMVKDMRMGCRLTNMQVAPNLHYIEDISLIIENTLFPFLFPHNRGWAPTEITIPEYLSLRMQMSFSVWTLFKPYVLLMAQIKQALSLATNVTSLVLEKSLNDYQRDHPTCTDEAALRRVWKWTVPSTLPGSPMHHRVLLQELLVRKQRHGFPTLFLTLTCDEVLELRWSEFHDMEGILRGISPELSWKDAPVECTRLFLHRYKNVMKHHVLGRSGVFGKVDHYMTRFEVQGRGSLHAHVLLWINNADAERVRNEISAFACRMGREHRLRRTRCDNRTGTPCFV